MYECIEHAAETIFNSRYHFYYVVALECKFVCTFSIIYMLSVAYWTNVRKTNICKISLCICENSKSLTHNVQTSPYSPKLIVQYIKNRLNKILVQNGLIVTAMVFDVIP